MNPYQETIDWLESPEGETWSYKLNCGNYGGTTDFYQDLLFGGEYGFYSLKRTEECSYCTFNMVHESRYYSAGVGGSLDTEGPYSFSAKAWMDNFIINMS